MPNSGECDARGMVLSSTSNHCCHCFGTIGVGVVDLAGMVDGVVVFHPDLLGVILTGAGAISIDDRDIGAMTDLSAIFAGVDGAVEVALFSIGLG